METALKQRLLGAVVLIALAIIFVPMILSSNGPNHESGTGENVVTSYRSNAGVQYTKDTASVSAYKQVGGRRKAGLLVTGPVDKSQL